MKNPEEVPDWLAKGITYQLPKNKQDEQSKEPWTNYMLFSIVQIINVYHNRTRIFIPRTKKIATMRTERVKIIQM